MTHSGLYHQQCWRLAEHCHTHLFFFLAEHCHTHEILIWLKNENNPKNEHKFIYYSDLKNEVEVCGFSNIVISYLKLDLSKSSKMNHIYSPNISHFTDRQVSLFTGHLNAARVLLWMYTSPECTPIKIFIGLGDHGCPTWGADGGGEPSHHQGLSLFLKIFDLSPFSESFKRFF